MPRYKYTALDLDNNKVNSELDARDEDDFRTIMRRMELVPLKYRQLDEAKISYKLKTNEIADFCRQLTNMFASGITAVRAVQIIKDDKGKRFDPNLVDVFISIQEKFKEIRDNFNN